MADLNKRRANSALWIGLVVTVLAIASNFLYFFKLPPAPLPWINLTLPGVGLIFLLIGVVRAFSQPEIYRGKIWGSIVSVVAALVVAGSALFFVGARKMPSSTGAPQVGQRVPDFMLLDSTGQSVTLEQLFAAAPGMPQPKAVLLVFYRGYW